jgi:hypothetical protein
MSAPFAPDYISAMGGSGIEKTDNGAVNLLCRLRR